jgi:hypothetical protein
VLTTNRNHFSHIVAVTHVQCSLRLNTLVSGISGNSKTGKTSLYGKHIGRPNGHSEPESHPAGKAPEHSDGTQQPGWAVGSRSTKMFLYDASQSYQPE